jgi:hypothetical protein
MRRSFSIELIDGRRMNMTPRLGIAAKSNPAGEMEALLAERHLLNEKLETWRSLMTAADDGMDGDIWIDPEPIAARLDIVHARITLLRRRLH